MRLLILVLMVILVGLAFLFALQNATPVFLSFGDWGFSAPLSLVLYVSLGLGMLFGWSVGFLSRMRLAWQIRRLKQQTVRD